MAREDPQFRIRLPSDLKARVEEAANLAGRSLNAEIVYRLHTSFLLEEPHDALKLSPGQLSAFDAMIERIVDRHIREREEDLIADYQRDRENDQ